MRKLLRRLKKGFKTACLTTALVTCWNIGQVCPVYADTVTLKLSGTVSPAENDISDLYMIFATGVSSFINDLYAVKLGNFFAGSTTPFTVYSDMENDSDLHWFAAGLYGDTSNNQYDGNINGVTASIRADEGDSWSTFFDVDESIIFDNILNDDVEALTEYISPFQYKNSCWQYEEFSYPSKTLTDQADLWNFSQAVNNGLIQFEAEIVPEPITLVLLGGGWIFVVASRRQKH